MASALSYALRLLKSRLRSAWEVDQALLRRGVDAEERKQVITELTEQGLLDDMRFGMAWVHTRDRLAPRGRFLLEQELHTKGIDKATIRLVMEKRAEEMQEEPELNPNEDEQIKLLVERKQRLYANLSEEVRVRRLTAFLARRGFSPDRVRRILNT